MRNQIKKLDKIIAIVLVVLLVLVLLLKISTYLIVGTAIGYGVSRFKFNRDLKRLDNKQVVRTSIFLDLVIYGLFMFVTGYLDNMALYSYLITILTYRLVILSFLRQQIK